MTLAPEILEDLIQGDPSQPVPTEPQLRKLAQPGSPAAQVKLYRRLLRQERASLGSQTASNPDRRAHRRGFQPLFALARKYQAMCESGEYRNLRALGAAEGISGERVGQVLALLSLAPDIIAQLDVPAERLPHGFGWKDLLKLTRVRAWEEQRHTFCQRMKSDA